MDASLSGCRISPWLNLSVIELSSAGINSGVRADSIVGQMEVYLAGSGLRSSSFTH